MYDMNRLTPDQAELDTLKNKMQDYIAGLEDDDNWIVAQHLETMLEEAESARCIAERETG